MNWMIISDDESGEPDEGRKQEDGGVKDAGESVMRDMEHLVDLCNLARKKAHDCCSMMQWSVPERDVAEGELRGIASVLERATKVCTVLIGSHRRRSDG